jgi:adenosylcobinamide amidohydrolase
MQEMGIRSRVSDAAATGTGTDSTIILYPESSPGDQSIEYAGMHTITGELVARTVMNALKGSLSWYVK